VPIARHSVRLALADHLDVTFQEANHVRLRRDESSPTTHAHLKIMISTRRLNTDVGKTLLGSFLGNASIASEILGLVVHTVEHQILSDNAEGSSHPDEGQNASLIDMITTGEDEDEYAKYYAPLEKNAEQLAQPQASGERSVAGVPVPSSIPTFAIVAVAGGIVLLLASIIGCVLIRRKRLLAQDASSNAEKTVEDDVPASAGKSAV